MSTILLYILLGRPIRVIRHPKHKRPNLFKDIGLSGELFDLDLIMEPELGRLVSISSKTMYSGKCIHPKFDFVFDEATHGPKLYSHLTL